MLPLLAVGREHNGVETLLSSLSLSLWKLYDVMLKVAVPDTWVYHSLDGRRGKEIDKALSYAWYGT